jgi:CheY-like chemotaxis protein
MNELLADVPILVVEDDPSGARMLATLLTSEGADVRVVRTAEEALALLRAFPARAIVVDLILPGTSGLDLIRRLTADATTRGGVIVAVSVVNGPRIEEEALASGCVAFLRKPIDTQLLPRILATHLRG